MSTPVLHLLVDGAPGVGAGHLGRSLALAQAWCAAGGQARLIDTPSAAGWADRYRQAGVEVGGSDVDPDVAVVDGYRYDRAAIERCSGDAPVVVIDDHGVGGHRGATLVVDQNVGASVAPYGEPAAGVLAGLRYALLRQEVVRARPVVPVDRSASPGRLAVAMGGDPSAAVRERIGGAASVAADRFGLALVPLQGLSDLGAVLADVDLALTASGSTLWELALFGIPAVAVAVADNQVPVARRAGQLGLAVDGGDIATVDVEGLVALVGALVTDLDRRVGMAAAGRAAIDGLGARRVATAARSLLVSLRRATADDARLLWEWANEPGVRASSFHPDPIPWDGHVAWLGRLLERTDAAQWIVTDHHGVTLGQVRVELGDDGLGVVDFSLVPDRRKAGWSGALLAAAARQAAAELGPIGLTALHADVLAENPASARAFELADFVPGLDGSTDGRRYHTYTRPCDG